MPLSVLETYLRVFVDLDRLDSTSRFYQTVFNGRETQRFNYPETGLTLAAVTSPQLSVLIVAGPPDKRASFEQTRLTVAVDSLDAAIPLLGQHGAKQLEPIQPTPKGRKTRFLHEDGLMVEYVENRSTAAHPPRAVS